jgi:hypothetical protein
MDSINLQVKLSGDHKRAFDMVKNRPELRETRKNTETVKRLIEATPEWKTITKK